jgi:hypothetical protein
MDGEELQRMINRITKRLQHLRDQICSSEKPGVDLMFELMTARQMLVDINEQQPGDPACREQIDEIDKLIGLYEQARGESNVKDTSNEQC